MRSDDRRPRHPAVIVETPIGVIYELDVWLSAEEVAVVTQGALLPMASRVYEPWVRITVDAAEVTTRAGIEIVEDQDDGA